MTEGIESLEALWSVAALKSGPTDALSAIPIGARLNGREVLAGVDAGGGKYVLFPISMTAHMEEDTESSGVHLRDRTLTLGGVSGRFVALGCTMPWLDDAFSNIASECINRVVNGSGERPDLVVHSVLESWRELLAKDAQKGLGDEAILGLIGELDMLAELAEANPKGAIAAWTGPSGGLHDFRNGRVALEVKSSRRRHGRTLSINGVEQLLPPPQSQLFLRFVRMERVPGAPVTLGSLAGRLFELGVSGPLFNKALGRLGLQSNSLKEYDDFEVDIVERRTYLVDDSFPRIVPSSFAGGELPQGVASITYTIELTQEPPVPMSPEEVLRLRRELVG